MKFADEEVEKVSSLSVDFKTTPEFKKKKKVTNTVNL